MRAKVPYVQGTIVDYQGVNPLVMRDLKLEYGVKHTAKFTECMQNGPLVMCIYSTSYYGHIIAVMDDCEVIYVEEDLPTKDSIESLISNPVKDNDSDEEDEDTDFDFDYLDIDDGEFWSNIADE